MAKKCIYCSAEISTNCVVDMCERCMYQVWGEKMAKAIIEGMERERDVGNLELGRVSNNKPEFKKNEKTFPVEEKSSFKETIPEYQRGTISINNEKYDIMSDEECFDFKKHGNKNTSIEEFEMHDIPRFD